MKYAEERARLTRDQMAIISVTLDSSDVQLYQFKDVSAWQEVSWEVFQNTEYYTSDMIFLVCQLQQSKSKQ